MERALQPRKPALVAGIIQNHCGPLLLVLKADDNLILPAQPFGRNHQVILLRQCGLSVQSANRRSGGNERSFLPFPSRSQAGLPRIRGRGNVGQSLIKGGNDKGAGGSRQRTIEFQADFLGIGSKGGRQMRPFLTEQQLSLPNSAEHFFRHSRHPFQRLGPLDGVRNFMEALIADSQGDFGSASRTFEHGRRTGADCGLVIVAFCLIENGEVFPNEAGEVRMSRDPFPPDDFGFIRFFQPQFMTAVGAIDSRIGMPGGC